MKVATVVGTRPEIIRLSAVMPALDRAFEHVVIHTGQNYDPRLNQIFFKELGLNPPTFSLRTDGVVDSMLSRLSDTLKTLVPDALLILGDTNSCFAAAYAAKRLKIPVFHMEAGNRCFDERVPEEINRRLIDHISDINMPYSSIAREYLLREGIPADRIIKTGSPLFEVLARYRDKIEQSNILTRLELKPRDYFVVSCHREENVDSLERLKQFIELLNALARKYSQRVVISVHPRTRKRLIAENANFAPEVMLSEPFGFFDYVHLQKYARVTLSDSGTITEESVIMDFPALNIRDAHERPEGMEEGSVIMTGLWPERVFESIAFLEQSENRRSIPRDYLVENVSEKVVKILLSYKDYINRVVWRKSV